MIITRLHIKNFMRYDDATIDFAPGFNAIVGQTDSGKSTVIRALQWVLYNRPSGMDIIRDGAEEAEVTIAFTKDKQPHAVTRLRSKKRNAYCLDGTWYDTVATGVPEPIAEATGVFLAELGPKYQEMLSISRQLDGPFLLSQPGSETAKILGNLSGITQIDAALASLRPDLLSIRKDIDAANKAERTYAISIKEYDDLEAQEKSLVHVKTQLRKAHLADKRIGLLTDIQAKMQTYNDAIAHIDEQIAGRVTKLSLLSPQLKRATALFTRYLKLQTISDQIVAYNQQREDVFYQIEVAQEKHDQLTKAYHAQLVIQGSCPTCGQPTKNL